MWEGAGEKDEGRHENDDDVFRDARDTGGGTLIAPDGQEDFGVETSGEFTSRKVVTAPSQPSQAQIDEHNIDHQPFRSWCELCVEARGTGEQQKQMRKGEIPIAFADLYVTKGEVLLREEAGETKSVEVKLLVVKNTMTAVRSRGATERVRPRPVREHQAEGGHRVAMPHWGNPKVGQRACDCVASTWALVQLKKHATVEQAGEEHPRRMTIRATEAYRIGLNRIKA